MSELSRKAKITWLVILGIIMLAFLAGFILIAEDIMYYTILDMDRVVYEFCLSLRTTWLTIIFTIITNLANPIVMGLIAVLLMLKPGASRKYSFVLFLNLGITAVLNLLFKFFFVRERPDASQSLVLEAGFSFPSGHAMFALAFYGFLIYMAWISNIKKGKKVTITILGTILIFLIGFSRLYLGVHYVSDVIGAFLITIDYLIVFLFIVSRSHIRFYNRKSDFKDHSLVQGFGYATRGIFQAFRRETNLLIDFAASMLVIVFGVTLRVSTIEWIILILLCVLVICMEMANTAIEAVCDKLCPGEDKMIRKAKDISAGAVLVMAIGACIIAAIIFLPKIEWLFM